LPNKEPYWPQTGKKTTIVVGEPIHFDDLVRDMKAAQKTPVNRHLLIKKMFNFFF